MAKTDRVLMCEALGMSRSWGKGVQVLRMIEVKAALEVAETIPAPASGVRVRPESEQAPAVPITARPTARVATRPLQLGHTQAFIAEGRRLLNQSTQGRYRLVNPSWTQQTTGAAIRKR